MIRIVRRVLQYSILEPLLFNIFNNSIIYMHYDQPFPRFSYFADLFHEPLGEWNNSKTWEMTKILVILQTCKISTVFSFNSSLSSKTRLTLKDTCKESQNPSVTKTYSVGFKDDAELSCKKYQGTLAIWFAERIFGAKLKNQTAELFETTESICCFNECLTIHKKITIITQFSLDILQI